MLREAADIIRTNADDISMLLALETGKALRTECVGEVNIIVEILQYFANLGSELKGRSVPFRKEILAITTREPLGVVAGIIPWNMPLMFLGYKLAAPLLTGNTVVLKAPETAPFTIFFIADLLSKVFPAGVFNVLVGRGESTGTELIEHPDIRKISFTGSVRSGRTVYSTAAKHLKQVNLELGGKSPMLVLPDCDLSVAVEGAIAGIRFTRQAQSCTSTTRVYLPSSVLDSFMENVLAQAAELRIGDPLDLETDTGSIVSAKQHARVMEFVEDARLKGMEPLVCGELPSGDGLENGSFMRPHFYVNPPHDAKIVQKEIFGPVMCVFSYETESELISKANDVDYGLSASVWGRDVSQCLRVARSLDVGFVQINQNAVMLPGLSYAGTKASGFGSETSLESMLQSFTREKTTIVNLGA